MGISVGIAAPYLCTATLRVSFAELSQMKQQLGESLIGLRMQNEEPLFNQRIDFLCSSLGISLFGVPFFSCTSLDSGDFYL